MGMTSGVDTCQLQDLPPVIQIQRPVPKPGTCPAGWNTHRKRKRPFGMMARPASWRGVRGQTDESREKVASANPPCIPYPPPPSSTHRDTHASGLRCSRRPRQPAANHPVHHRLSAPKSQWPMPNGLEVHKSMASFPPPGFLFRTP